VLARIGPPAPTACAAIPPESNVHRHTPGSRWRTIRSRQSLSILQHLLRPVGERGVLIASSVQDTSGGHGYLSGAGARRAGDGKPFWRTRKSNSPDRTLAVRAVMRRLVGAEARRRVDAVLFRRYLSLVRTSALPSGFGTDPPWPPPGAPPSAMVGWSATRPFSDQSKQLPRQGGQPTRR
jgi:hypothetical protein